jgi:hypothetical protein
LLSLDVDQATYWLWHGVRRSPRVAVIEYNAVYPPQIDWVVRTESVWDGSSHFGASLRALWRLGEERGYRLVACNFAGANAFFVRGDLAGAFTGPFTPEYHYEPPRYFLYTQPGHRRGWGGFETRGA